MEDERTTTGGQEEAAKVQVPPTSSRLGAGSAGISGSAAACSSVTGGKRKSSAAVGVNAEVPVTRGWCQARNTLRHWTPTVCSIKFVPFLAWMVRIFLRFTLYTPSSSSLFECESLRVYGDISDLSSLDVSAGARPSIAALSRQNQI
jgi:hypothetical protein